MREVFSFLLREKLIGLSLVKKILSWQHTGFNVHSKVRATTKKEAERPPPPQIVQQELLTTAEERGEYF